MKNFEDFRGFVDGEMMALVLKNTIAPNLNIGSLSQQELITLITSINVEFTMKTLEEYHKWLHFED